MLFEGPVSVDKPEVFVLLKRCLPSYLFPVRKTDFPLLKAIFHLT